MAQQNTESLPTQLMTDMSADEPKLTQGATAEMSPVQPEQDESDAELTIAMTELPATMDEPIDDAEMAAQTRLLVDEAPLPASTERAVDQTLAYPDDRRQPAAEIAADAPDQGYAPAVAQNTEEIASLDNTQMRPYALDPYEDEDDVAAIDADDRLAYDLSRQGYQRPASRARVLLTALIAGLLAAIVAYAITSIILHGGIRLPSTTSETQSSTTQQTTSKQDSTTQQQQQTQTTTSEQSSSQQSTTSDATSGSSTQTEQTSNSQSTTSDTSATSSESAPTDTNDSTAAQTSEGTATETTTTEDTSASTEETATTEAPADAQPVEEAPAAEAEAAAE